MLLSTLTAFSKSKRIGSFGPKRTCILQSVLGCLTQQTWETKETDRHHQVGDILSKRCHQRTKTKFPKRSVQQRGKGKMQQRKIKDATQELQHKMQQEIPKIQELQHKMQNPAAAVRNNLKNQKLLLLVPRDSIGVEIGEEKTREAKVTHQKDQQASLRPEAKVKHQKDQQPRQQRHHANHQATDRSHGEAEDRRRAVVAASHCEGKHKIDLDHSNAASHDAERNPWSRLTSPAKNTDRKKEALKIGAHKKEERTEEEKVESGTAAKEEVESGAKEEVESGTMIPTAKEEVESVTMISAAMRRAMISGTMMSAAMRRAMISGTTISAAMRRAMVSGTKVAAAKEKVAAAKEKVVKTMISAAISGALGSGAMITAAMKRPRGITSHGNPIGLHMINPKVVLWQAPKLEKMLPLPIIKRSGSQHPRASK